MTAVIVVVVVVVTATAHPWVGTLIWTVCIVVVAIDIVHRNLVISIPISSIPAIVVVTIAIAVVTIVADSGSCAFCV